MKKKNVKLEKLDIAKSTVANPKGGARPYTPPAEPIEEKCISRPQISCVTDWWP
ncbi:hypothetical protein [Kordia jejudonensis]|uniref:hypothetical protein n=1 Tax=Kordia jejudonensis TaxID=1348245 RepID=UPI0012E013B3|nr:hypothetical protein [Kordia jejudonensis]